MRTARRDGLGGAGHQIRETFRERRVRAGFRRYHRWIARRLASREKRRPEVDPGLLFSVVVPVFKPLRKHLRECISSVRRQIYSNWELILVDDGSEDPALTRFLRKVSRADSRVRVVALAANRGIGAATNAGLELARGDYVCFLDHDDALTRDALLLAACHLLQDPTTDFLYGDEDKVSQHGRLVEPWFRPDSNSDLLLAYNFVSHPVAVRRSLIQELGGVRSDLDGSQDHDLALRLADAGARFAHLPEVIYHWRISETSTSGSVTAKPYAANAGLRAVTESVARRGWKAAVRHGVVPNHYEVLFEIPTPVTVAVVVCSTNPPDAVLDSLRYVIDPDILRQDLDVTVIVVRPKLIARSTAGGITWPERWRHVKGSIHDYVGWPNTAAALNFGASKASNADVLVFVEDDVTAFSALTLKQLVGSVSRSGVGAVGAMEIGPDRRIRQSGILLMAHGPAYAFAEYDTERVAEHDLARSTREVTAVSCSIMATKADAFSALGGFPERFSEVYFDFAYCVRLRDELGLRVIVDPTFPVLKEGCGRIVDRADHISDFEKLALEDLLRRHSLDYDEFHAHSDVRLVAPPFTPRRSRWVAANSR